jgi:hypothetical protein
MLIELVVPAIPEHGGLVMAIESQAVPVAQPPPGRAGSVPVAAPSSRNGSRSSSESSSVPVAQPAPPRPSLGGEVIETADEIMPPSALKGWVTSVILHALLLLFLALWVFTPKLDLNKIIDTKLAGSPFGDESGDSLTGGLGMDTPLLMPEAANAPVLETATLTSLPTDQLNIDSNLAKSTAPTGASNGGGVNLSNPGAGGSGDGFGVAKYGQGGEAINGVEVRVGDPQFTLIWNSRADLDLHVQEPGGSHIYWESRNGAQGGELDVDDVDGFGPENIYWVQGQGPPGEYKWYVHYYGGLGGIAVPTRWKMRLKHDGGVKVFEGQLTFVGQKSNIYSFKLGDGKSQGGKKEEKKDAK